ncbi:hypothetical protein N7462_010745 [Penicillium macrosclerotiorum]|uniref:uncharacterized protein n=1 Tax=Penicillium macrosclerotiorum TaxID=303699 RepID=UPI00254736FC|nr:uncharacterized protein N7462_010745 [Penicillium macrosclerotiorum]KAJ5669675.1 hypothetical protein N7462_010745 [Penicillium macrosclerotiorum]
MMARVNFRYHARWIKILKPEIPRHIVLGHVEVLLGRLVSRKQVCVDVPVYVWLGAGDRAINDIIEPLICACPFAVAAFRAGRFPVAGLPNAGTAITGPLVLSPSETLGDLNTIL